MRTIYLDATVFLYPTLYADGKAARAAKLLGRVAAGKEPAITASLTFDEVIWKVRKHLGPSKGFEAADAFLGFPNLRILPVGVAELRRAAQLMRDRPHLHPRDAIHAATALGGGASRIVTDDADFESVPGLVRERL